LAFIKGVGHFEHKFQMEGASPTNHCWYQSSRVIALSCGIKISAVHHLVLSQSTRVTDGRTELRLPRPLFGSSWCHSLCVVMMQAKAEGLPVSDLLCDVFFNLHLFDNISRLLSAIVALLLLCTVDLYYCFESQ